ncbi:hypothetical protein IW262DRAFT_959740 [Armillaria fumosa]|nr:hypothetical protein IW262DRAFT_959740 [Armillaria fumosa]
MKINITGGTARVVYHTQAPTMILSIVSNTSLSPVHPHDDHLSLNVVILVAVACVLSVFLSTVLLFFFCPPFRGWLDMGNQLFARHVAPLYPGPFGSLVAFLCVLHPSVYRFIFPQIYPFKSIVLLSILFLLRCASVSDI